MYSNPGQASLRSGRVESLGRHRYRRRDSSTIMQAEAVEPLRRPRISMSPMKGIPQPSTVQMKRFLHSWCQGVCPAEIRFSQ